MKVVNPKIRFMLLLKRLQYGKTMSFRSTFTIAHERNTTPCLPITSCPEREINLQSFGRCETEVSKRTAISLSKNFIADFPVMRLYLTMKICKNLKVYCECPTSRGLVLQMLLHQKAGEKSECNMLAINFREREERKKG